ncbi:MAG TPA: ABC transporter permease [Desulfosporosinus sp.]|nr:ABC transporter permease [Desulfosporosinus sp.]
MIFLTFWELAPRVGLVSPIFVPTFSQAVLAIVKMVKSGAIIGHVTISLYRAFAGLLLSLAVGIPLGVAIGSNKKAQDFLNPILSLFGQVSPMALFPVFIIVLGVGEESKVGIIFWSCVWPILLNTVSGVSHADYALIKAARVMGASPLQVLLKVIMPTALPEIFPGLRISTSMSLVMLCAAEMLGAKKGLGFLISYSQQIFQIADMYAAIILIAILGLLLNYAVTALENKVLAWKKIN